MSARSLVIEPIVDGVAVLRFDVPGASVNTLRKEFEGELHEALEHLRRIDGLRGVVFTSGKRDSFVVGADLEMLEGVSDGEIGETLARIGQRALDELEAFPVPIVAAIGGACLGGGLELALACRFRIAADDEKVKLGLPEVQLGLLPGMGGTQRLPRLIGLEGALDLLLTGKQLDARRAAKLGLVDEVVPPSLLLARARARLLAEARPKTWSGHLRSVFSPEALREFALAENPLGRHLVFEKARKSVALRTRGNYPAPERLLSVVRTGLERGMRAGLEAEAKAFGELAVTPESRALRHVFFAEQSAKKKWSVEANPTSSPDSIEVIGAGLMGAGIAAVSLHKAKLRVRLRDVDEGRIRTGLAQLARYFEGLERKRRIVPRDRVAFLGRLTTSTSPSGSGRADLVLEAVYEDIELKRAILREFEEHASDDAVFASNTSAIPIARIASAARRPERVLGMHYFSPVEKMPLLEIVRTKVTSKATIETAVDLGRRQGKTVIVVGDGPGFYTTRILAPYLNEAAYLLLEGAGIEAIDEALVAAGFPVGPLTLLDEIGIDVGAKVSHTLAEAFGVRMQAPESLGKLVLGGRLGRKSGRGFYRYESGKRSETADEDVYSELSLARRGPSPDPADIVERCLLAMVNEAAHCLDAGVLDDEADGDVGAIFGLGFPPFLGGPFHYVKTQTRASIVERLRRLERRHGSRFTPARGLLPD